MPPLRVALIGCGFIGRRHLENVAVRDDIELRATGDIREDAARAFCDEFHGRYHTTEPDRIFDDREVDAVIICTHHDSHTPLALKAAATGKHILLEKPMALTVEDCQRISAAASQAGIALAVNFKFRFAPAVLKSKEIIQHPIVTHGQLSMEAMPAGIWVRDPVRGGGLILATACHALDMIYWLNESEPVRVHAESVPRLPEQGCNVTAVAATVRLANGAIASLLMAEAGENSYVGKWPHQVFDGSRSAVLYEHFRQASFSGAAISHFRAEDEIRADGTFGMMEDFVTSIRTGRSPTVSGRDGLRATLLARTILDSLRSGQVEEIRLDGLED